jgi:hypothetical protein
MKRNSLLGSTKRWLTALMLVAVVVLGVARTAPARDQRHNDEIKQALLQSSSIHQGFPRLTKDNCEVIGDATPGYNCIAYSLGIYDRWVNPRTGPADAPFSDMDELYAARGYRRQPGLNWQPERGVEKVVLYATLNPDGTVDKVTHAARQDRDGAFSSKLGQAPLIRHATPEDLRGSSYGLPVAVYVRPAIEK